MCKIYNTVGSLTVVKSHLLAHDIDEFKSIKELIDFQKNYPALQQQIVVNHRQVIQNETASLTLETPQLKKLIDEKRAELEQQKSIEVRKLEARLNSLDLNHSNIFHRFINHLKRVGVKRKLFSVSRNFENIIASSLNPLITDFNIKNVRYNFITTRFDDAVSESSERSLSELARKKNVIDQINNYIYGAIGEQKIVKELEKLSNEYVLINDFTLEFHPAIYRKQNNDYIKSIQIDHILVSTSGIFLIETKNWTQKSMDNIDLHSPVDQIKRTNYALYRLLNERISSSKLRINTHHWGDRKIPIRNLIVLIKHKPTQEFQHVKLLALEELLNYITYFQPSISNNDVQTIASELESINKALTYI